jgi:hypothetical protein
MQKEILILAKSIKRGDCCIAGVEMENTAGGHRVLGHNWVRPVSESADGACSGAIPKAECDTFCVGDIVLVDLSRPAPIFAQEENWIWAGTPFRKSGQLRDNRILSYLTNSAQQVWSDPATARDDQISEDAASQQNIGHSLMLVAPANLTFSLELKQTDYGLRKSIFASFVYQGKTYQRLAVTDPALRKVFFNQFPQSVGITVSKTLNHGDNYWLTLSLSPKFGPVCGGPAHHYALVAAVIDHSGYLNRTFG